MQDLFSKPNGIESLNFGTCPWTCFARIETAIFGELCIPILSVVSSNGTRTNQEHMDVVFAKFKPPLLTEG